MACAHCAGFGAELPLARACAFVPRLARIATRYLAGTPGARLRTLGRTTRLASNRHAGPLRLIRALPAADGSCEAVLIREAGTFPVTGKTTESDPMDERSGAMMDRAGSVVPSLLLALAASPAWAHPGYGASGLPTGLPHPITGPDHLLATFGVGLLPGQLAARYANRSSPGGGRASREGARAIVATVGFATAAGLLLGALLATLSGASGSPHGGTAVELAARRSSPAWGSPAACCSRAVRSVAAPGASAGGGGTRRRRADIGLRAGRLLGGPARAAALIEAADAAPR